MPDAALVGMDDQKGEVDADLGPEILATHLGK